MNLADESTGMVLLTGNSHPELARLLSDRLGIRLADVVVYNKTNRGTFGTHGRSSLFLLLRNERGRQAERSRQACLHSANGLQVSILFSAWNLYAWCFRDVNNNVMELMILIYACKTSMAKTITVILPYLPYSKQCRMLRRSAIPGKLVADMICKAGARCLSILCFI